MKSFDVQLHELKYHKTSDQRAQLITHLLELDPTIFGPSSWLQLATLSSDYIEIYDSRAVFSLAHNEKIYNRSKVSVSTNHTQNTTGYPWRIHDIMGSSSVLLAESKRELINDFSRAIKLQLFHSPAEALEMARKLVNNETMRHEIVAQQNEAIDKEWRWKYRFPLIQQLTGVDLQPIPGNIGSYELFRLKTRLPIYKKKPLKRLKKYIKKTVFTKKVAEKHMESEYS